MSSDPPELGEVMTFPDEPRDDDRRWLVLFPDDFDNFGRDPDGNLAVLVDQQQAGEILHLAAETVAALSHKDADDGDVIDDLIDGLKDARESDRDE
jgi:hypothetical protein